jgi:hypothetical protein
VHDKAIYAPIWQLGSSTGSGRASRNPGIGQIPGFAYSGPYEDVKLRAGK